MKKKILLVIGVFFILFAALLIKEGLFREGRQPSIEISDQIEVKEERVFLNGEEIPDTILVTKTESGKEYSGLIPKKSSQVVDSSGTRKVTFSGMIPRTN